MPNRHIAKNGLWEHMAKWHQFINLPHEICWNKTWLENSWCKDCKYCCGPQGADAPFPMALLPCQVSPENMSNFYMLNENTAYIGSNGCKSNTEKGCRLDISQKPVACNLFPIVLINGRLYLYLKCPAVMAAPLLQFLEFAGKAASSLYNLALDDLKHISITLNADMLAAKYIDLHIQLFDEKGKALIFD